MAQFEKGNTASVGNNGGRPPIYDASKQSDIDKVDELCKSYFSTLKEFQPPTVTGFTLHLGFANKSTLYEYSKALEFTNSIKSVLTAIEQYHEEMTAGGDKCVGNIFILKNFGWKDTQDHSGEIKGIASPTTIVFKSYEKDGD